MISDRRLPCFDAIRAFDVLRVHRPDVPFIIMSGTMPEEADALAMRLGADALGVAVNVSAAQFGKPVFDLHVAAALAESDLDPGRLELEITETIVRMPT